LLDGTKNIYVVKENVRCKRPFTLQKSSLHQSAQHIQEW
jgi:hypothetical protein